MLRFFRRKIRSPSFWDWLAANTVRIQQELKEDPQGASKEIRRAFKQFYPDLVWESSPAESGPWLFCVSADGDRKLFPQVEQAVKAAPMLSEWKVIAFRPRGSLDAEIEMGGRKLGYEDIWCSVDAGTEGVDAKLWIRGLNPDSDEALSSAALILLDNAIGEYDAVMKINQLDRGPLLDNPQKTDRFFPLAELPKYLDCLKSGAEKGKS
jgi:hypothetical protein